jgi:hypothetical protein
VEYQHFLYKGLFGSKLEFLGFEDLPLQLTYFELAIIITKVLDNCHCGRIWYAWAHLQFVSVLYLIQPLDELASPSAAFLPAAQGATALAAQAGAGEGSPTSRGRRVQGSPTRRAEAAMCVVCPDVKQRQRSGPNCTVVRTCRCRGRVLSLKFCSCPSSSVLRQQQKPVLSKSL